MRIVVLYTVNELALILHVCLLHIPCMVVHAHVLYLLDHTISAFLLHIFYKQGKVCLESLEGRAHNNYIQVSIVFRKS